MTLAASLGIGVVRAYQWTVRPLIGANCRFWPSCSEYAAEALRVHGALGGSVLATKRILRCNPWNEGGVDPVPAPATDVHGTGAPATETPGTDAPGTDRQMRHRWTKNGFSWQSRCRWPSCWASRR